jgi:ribosomal protein S18 acetylase RimI-like enzyme
MARGTEAAPDPGAGITYRRPAEADYLRIVRVVDDWWGRSLSSLLPRLWLQHFTGTSWLAEQPDGRIAGFLIGFLSPDHADMAYCHMIATSPSLRRHGVGAALYEHFISDARADGRTILQAVTWPGNYASLAFHRSLGFEIVEGPGSQNLYGTPAQAGFDFDRDDKAIMIRRI